MNMLLFFQKSFPLFPVLILMFSILFTVLCICINRNHKLIYFINILSFVFSLIFLFILNKLIIYPCEFMNVFVLNYYSFFNEVLIFLTSFFTCFFSYFWLKRSNINKEELYLLITLSTLGAILLVVSNNVMFFYISLELFFLPLLGLVGFFINDKFSLESTLKYFILSNFTSIFLLLGISLIYLILGSFDISVWNHIFEFISFQDKNILITGFSLILISLIFKLAIFPFYFWISDVYKGIAFPILIYFSIIAKITIFSFLFKILNIIPINYINIISLIIYVISFISIIFGNLMALTQNNIKKLFGYISIANFGYILIVLVSFYNKFLIFEVNYLYLFNYFLINLGFFGTLSVVSNFFYIGKNIDDIFLYKGLFWKSPFLAFSLTVSLCSAIGVPFTLGFISKFYLFFFLFNQNFYLLIFFILIGNIIGIYSYLKIISVLYLNPSNLLFRNKYSFFCLFINYFCLLFIIILIIFFGLFPNILLNFFSY